MARGAVVGVEGMPGAGATSVALALAAAVTAVGEWAAAVDLDGTLGGRAAAEAGVALDRFAVVRRRRETVAPGPLGHRGRHPARRREPGDRRACRGRFGPPTPGGWWPGHASAR